jgi:hypothetical protein
MALLLGETGLGLTDLALKDIPQGIEEKSSYPAVQVFSALGRFPGGLWRRMLAKKRLLSMRPLKIGTPVSKHFESTSRRPSPDSRASSVGVR